VTGEQTTLGRFDGGEDGDGPADTAGALRRDVDRLTELMNTLAESQRDLAAVVEEALPDDSGDDPADAVDGTRSGRGFQ